MISVLLTLNIMFCDIKGEVKNPGVYEIKNNNIMDVITLAGGLTKDANINNINLSKKVYDEMVIYIPSKKDKIKKCFKCVCPVNKCSNIILKPNIKITTSIPHLTSKIITTTKKTLININIDSFDGLISIDGIGEVIANRIIEYRNETLFITIEDILNIKGIGQTLFAKIKDFITV